MYPQVIGNKWDTYLDLLQADYSEGCAHAMSVPLRVAPAAQPVAAAANPKPARRSPLRCGRPRGARGIAAAEDVECRRLTRLARVQ